MNSVLFIVIYCVSVVICYEIGQSILSKIPVHEEPYSRRFGVQQVRQEQAPYRRQPPPRELQLYRNFYSSSKTYNRPNYGEDHWWNSQQQWEQPSTTTSNYRAHQQPEIYNVQQRTSSSPFQQQPSTNFNSRTFASTLKPYSAAVAIGKKFTSNADLINNLISLGIIHSKSVEHAMKTIDRADFSPSLPYLNAPQSIGHGSTISAPYMHAYALEILEPNLKPSSKVLDIGSGSGYLSACMAIMAGKYGKVIGIEHIEQLVHISIANVKKRHKYLLDSKRLELIKGDGRFGYPLGGPFDVIHVGAASAVIPPILLDQLNIGGRLVIPIGPITGTQKLTVLDKLDDKGSFRKEVLMDVVFVPLTSRFNGYY